MKIASHELKSLDNLLNCQVVGLHFPLLSLIDYRGFRLIAVSTLPVSNDTLFLGSSNAGKTVNNKDKMYFFIFFLPFPPSLPFPSLPFPCLSFPPSLPFFLLPSFPSPSLTSPPLPLCLFPSFFLSLLCISLPCETPMHFKSASKIVPIPCLSRFPLSAPFFPLGGSPYFHL